MKLHRVLGRAPCFSGAFTLIEILVTISIFSILILGVSSLDLSLISKTALYEETELLSRALFIARDKAMLNASNTQFGVHISKENIEIFYGPAYISDAVIQLFKRNKAIEIQAEGEIVFERITGTTNPSEIVVMLGKKSNTLSINRAGTISW